MVDRKLIFELYKNRHSKAEIGRISGVSRQRIHQILMGYGTIRHKNKSVVEKLKSGCAICGGKSSGIHHIDRNSSNNTLENLLPICNQCHYEIHKGDKRVKFKHFDSYHCQWCGKRFVRWHGYNAGAVKFCSHKCRGQYTANNKEKGWSHKYSECVNCRTTSIPYWAKGLCKNCYARILHKKKIEREKELI